MLQSSRYANCQGKDFKGASLQGADFSYANIQGADFSQADLTGANFNHAKTGLTSSWVIALTLLIILMTFLAGLVSGYSGALAADLSTHTGRTFFGVFSLISLVLYGFIVIRKGLGAVLTTYIEIAVACLVAAIAFFPEYQEGKELIVGANFSLLVLGGVLAGLGNIAVAIALAKLMNLLKPKLWILGIAAFGILLGVLFGVRECYESCTIIAESVSIALVRYLVASLVGFSNIFLGLYIGQQALLESPKYRLVRKTSIFLLAQKGTRFCGADLTDANFSQATFHSTDFRKAILTRTNWFGVKKLDRARLDEGIYLANDRIRQLLITREGEGKNYNYLNLQGLNLESANLQEASLIGTNLSEASLAEANLARAKLAQTQLYQANLKNTQLTGAFIEDWGISSKTQFEGVICHFIHMRLPTSTDPDPCRKPDNKEEKFNPGDFETFISPIIKTLALYQQQNVDPRRMATTYKTVDLFHHEGIDPSAAAIALKQLAEQFPEAGLEVVALEGRGEEKIRLQARVAGQVDRSQISADYFEKYREVSDLPYGDLQSLLAAMSEKDKHIRRLEGMVNTAMQSDRVYIETNYSLASPPEENPPVKKVLILTATPQNADQRRLDAEVREIQAELERAKQRDQFEIVAKWAVRTEDLRRALIDYEPHIVQFSGYGDIAEGLVLENEVGEIKFVSTAALSSLFDIFQDTVECVFLNACYSDVQAKAISSHIPYVIGMCQAVGDQPARKFAVGFYGALGAGRSIEDAFKFGCVAIELEGLPESLIPVLKKRD